MLPRRRRRRRRVLVHRRRLGRDRLRVDKTGRVTSRRRRRQTTRISVAVAVAVAVDLIPVHSVHVERLAAADPAPEEEKELTKKEGRKRKDRRSIYRRSAQVDSIISRSRQLEIAPLSSRRRIYTYSSGERAKKIQHPSCRKIGLHCRSRK